MKMKRKWWMLAALGAILVTGCAQETAKPDANAGESATTGGTAAPDAGTTATKDSAKSIDPSAAIPDKKASTPEAGNAKPDANKPTGVPVKEDAIADTGEKPATDGKVDAMNATKPEPKPAPKPDAKLSSKVPPSPRAEASMDRLDRLASKADPKTTAGSYVGSWSFKMTEENAKKLKQGIMGAGYKGTFYTPSYQMTINSNGTFTAKEQFMSFDRDVSGTYKFEKGSLRCTIKTVNGAPPKAKSDKAGWALIINKEGKLERSDEVKLSKK